MTGFDGGRRRRGGGGGGGGGGGKIHDIFPLGITGQTGRHISIALEKQIGLQKRIGMLAVDAKSSGEAFRQFVRRQLPVLHEDAGFDAGFDDVIVDFDANIVEIVLDEDDLTWRGGSVAGDGLVASFCAGRREGLRR